MGNSLRFWVIVWEIGQDNYSMAEMRGNLNSVGWLGGFGFIFRVWLPRDTLGFPPVVFLVKALCLSMGAVLPRSFRLLEELEKGEKGMPGYGLSTADSDVGLGDGSCSYGLADGDDIMMTNWNGTILGPPHVFVLHKLWTDLYV